MGSVNLSVFLYAATPPASRSGSLVRPFLWRALWASDNSNPRPSSASSNWQVNTVSQIPCRLHRRSCGESTGRWSSRLPVVRAPKSLAASSFGRCLAMTADRDLLGRVSPSVLVPGTTGAIARPNLAMSVLDRPLNGSCGQIRASVWPEAVAAPMLGVFLAVSYPTI